MRKILRRPMFRGGPVDSRGTGITSGLMDDNRVGYYRGGGPTYNPFTVSQVPADQLGANIVGRNTPNDLYDFTGKIDTIDLKEFLKPADITQQTDFKPRVTKTEKIEQPFEDDFEVSGEAGVVEDGKTGIDTIFEQGEERAKERTENNETNNNQPSNVEISAQDLIKENAELFKELLGEGQKEKIKKARIGDASDYLLKFFEGSQREGATVGSSAAEVAKFATSKDSKTERAKAAIEKTDQTATALAINDYIAGKRSKEQVEAMMAKSDIGFAQAIALADYKKGKEDFFENLKENRKGMGSAEAIITTVQETFKKVPTVLTDKDIKQENFGLLNEENVGEYFVYPDGKVTKIDKIGNELTEVVIYTRGG